MTTVHDRSPGTGTPVRHAGLLAVVALAVAGVQINATMPTPAVPDVIERLHTTSGPWGSPTTPALLIGGALALILFAAVQRRSTDRHRRRRTNQGPFRASTGLLRHRHLAGNRRRRMHPGGQPTSGAFHAALLSSEGFMVLALLSALLIKPPPAAPAGN